MEMPFTPNQQAFIRDAIAARRLHRLKDAMLEAITLWEGREQTWVEVLTGVGEAEISLARGEGIEISYNIRAQLS